MNLLLDTHVLIWALENNPALSSKARQAIVDGSNVVFVSSVSVWEISIKTAMGKLQVPTNIIEEVAIHRFTQLAVKFNHAKLAGELPNIHKDPFDRMLVAQAMVEKLTLVTHDKQLSKYDVPILKT